MSNPINNQLFNQPGDIWWQPDTPLNLLQTVVNPGRVGYFRRIVNEELHLPTRQMSALEVGCGGGILSEEIARFGFSTTGLDPSEQAVQVARQHALRSKLSINYIQGSGESLPCADASFDVIFCCDVLEHVRDLPRVIGEISRVLKPGGFFFYDTLNRTLFSKLVAIKIWQDWKAFAFMPRDLHVWEKFIKPRELIHHLSEQGLRNQDVQGLAPAVNPVTVLIQLNRRVRGRATYRDLAENIKLRESRDKRILYVGYAVKTPPKGDRTEYSIDKP